MGHHVGFTPAEYGREVGLHDDSAGCVQAAGLGEVLAHLLRIDFYRRGDLEARSLQQLSGDCRTYGSKTDLNHSNRHVLPPAKR